MWLMHLLPDSLLQFFTHLIMLLGVILTTMGVFIRYFPILMQYSLPIKIIGGVLLILGVYFEGGYSVERIWRDKVAELQVKVKEAEEKSIQANDELEKALEVKNDKTKEVQIVIKERIRVVAEKVDMQCKIDKEVISILNKAAKNDGEEK
jgi:hypothetical protein